MRTLIEKEKTITMENDDIVALVIVNGSGICKEVFTVDDAPRNVSLHFRTPQTCGERQHFLSFVCKKHVSCLLKLLFNKISNKKNFKREYVKPLLAFIIKRYCLNGTGKHHLPNDIRIGVN